MVQCLHRMLLLCLASSFVSLTVCISWCMSLSIVLRHAVCVARVLCPAAPVNLSMSLYVDIPSFSKQSCLLQISKSLIPSCPFHCSHFGSSRLTHS